MTTCVAGERCREYDRTTQTAGEPGATPLCESCLTHSARALPLLVHDYRDLEQLLPRTMGQNLRVDISAPSLEPPVPIRLDVDELQRRIWHLATTWAEVLSDRHRLSDPPVKVREGYAVAWAVGILAPRAEHLARLDAVQMVNYPDDDATVFRTIRVSYIPGALGLLQLAQAHQHARSMLGLTEPVYELPGHCQNRGCGRAELRVKDGSDTVWCDHCGTQMTRDDYDRYGNLFLREAA